jgi:hypothetical protein
MVSTPFSTIEIGRRLTPRPTGRSPDPGIKENMRPQINTLQHQRTMRRAPPSAPSVGKRWQMLAFLACISAAGCSAGDGGQYANWDLSDRPGHGTAIPEPGDQRLFTDDFEADEPSQWTPYAGLWSVRHEPGASGVYDAPVPVLSQSVAGSLRWQDYDVQARVTLQKDQGKVGLLGRVEGTHHYYEFLLGRDDQGVRSWFIRKRIDHAWTTLASGPFDYETGPSYVLRFSLRGNQLQAFIASGDEGAFQKLGAVRDDTFAWGRIGVGSYFARADFDDVVVDGSPQLALAAGPWGPIAELRDNSTRFPNGKPAGGWYVTPIHATLRPSDGNVVLTGFGRKAEVSCTGGTSRETGETFVIAPSQLDSLADGDTLLVQPLDEQNADPTHEVLYCAGHNSLADGRIFYSAGTRYPSTLPNASPELGLSYSRIFDPQTNAFTRISAAMKGGQSTTDGMKWYPTQQLMPDGRVLIFGGFHWSVAGTGSAVNLSLELFDPKIWDANHAADPYTVLTDHDQGQAETPPTRGYTNLFVLPKSVPAANANGFARSVALAGGVGKVFLFNHEPGPTQAQRLFARPSALTPNPSATEKGEGASGLMLPDGKLMFPNGGHDGSGSAQVYFYDPYADSWTTLPGGTGISRIYGNAIWLPDGTVLLVNGYVSEPGNVDDVINPQGAPDGVRKAQIIDPFARTVVTQPAWPEPTGRGYHSFALLLKDGRVLIGGGKDGNHATGCEKNELRIYSPPYLSAGTRPSITNVASGQTLTTGGSLTINYTGTVRATRGVVLMAPGSITHAFDQGQRYVPLIATAGPSAGTVTVSLPATIEQAQPGQYLLHVISDLGVPSVGVHVRLLPPTACVFNANGASQNFLEAETTSRRAGPFLRIADATRSGGAYMQVDPATTSIVTVPDEGKVMWYDLNVASGGNFYLWLLANGADTNSDSFFVSVDGNPDQAIMGLPTSSWGWARSGNTFSLPTGKHTLKVKVREHGTKLDMLMLTTSTSTTPPSGFGGTALTCGGNQVITNLVVNDTANGKDTIPNNTQWSIEPSFGAGQLAFNDRAYTIGTLPAAAAHFNGKNWIRPSADSRNYTATNPPLATAQVNAPFVFIAIDNRHNSTPIANAGYANQGYTFPVIEGPDVRTYNVWRKSITSGSTVTLPTLVSTGASMYLVIVE